MVGSAFEASQTPGLLHVEMRLIFPIRKAVFAGFSMTTRPALVPLLLLFLGIAPAFSVPIDGGFETGDLTGWTVEAPLYSETFGGYGTLGSANVTDRVFSLGMMGPDYLPKEGRFLATLMADNGGLNPPPQGQISRLAIEQTLTVHSGDVLSGWAAFSTMEYYPARSRRRRGPP